MVKSVVVQDPVCGIVVDQEREDPNIDPICEALMTDRQGHLSSNTTPPKSMSSMKRLVLDEQQAEITCRMFGNDIIGEETSEDGIGRN